MTHQVTAFVSVFSCDPRYPTRGRKPPSPTRDPLDMPPTTAPIPRSSNTKRMSPHSEREGTGIGGRDVPACATQDHMVRVCHPGREGVVRSSVTSTSFGESV
jgi:hypothetical protein